MNVVRSRHVRWLLVGLLVTGGCGRPSEPLKVGVREVRNDIVLGADAEVPPAASVPLVPPTSVVLSIPTQLPPAPPRFAPTPMPLPGTSEPPTEPPAPACPDADALAAPRLEAPRTTASPPVEEVLSYRNRGSFSVSGENANEGTFAGDSPREVKDVVIDDDGFSYDVVAELEGTITTTSYRVATRPADDTLGPILDQSGVKDGRGLYLTRIANEAPDGSTSSFTPATPMLMLPLPANIGDTFTSQGVDGDTGTTMTFDARVGEGVRVNACGEPVHGILVEVSNGRILGPTVDVTFTARYVYATQFGGLLVEDEVTTAGTEAGRTSTRTNLARVNRVPTSSQGQERR